jgi:hypothetical protein
VLQVKNHQLIDHEGGDKHLADGLWPRCHLDRLVV